MKTTIRKASQRSYDYAVRHPFGKLSDPPIKDKKKNPLLNTIGFANNNRSNNNTTHLDYA